jgi:DNA repair protein RadA/Sms
MLQLASRIAKNLNPIVYISGEESLIQIKLRSDRLRIGAESDIFLISEQNLDASLGCAMSYLPRLLIVDSIQTVFTTSLDSTPGSVGQVRECAAVLTKFGKDRGLPVLIVGHVTKDGAIAGPKILEHLVDTVLYFEGELSSQFRILRVFKNRFGPTDELMVLEMMGDGLAPVPDPSTYFLGERDETASGSAVVLALEGKRPFAVEVQALASKSYLAMPRRTALGLDLNRLNLLLAVLEKRLGIQLGQSDIYAKTGGGLKLTDPGLDLGLVAAVLSSYYDRPLPPRAVFWGEVDLSGRIRPVSGHEARLKQAKRLGYKPIFHPPVEGKGTATLKDFQKALFGAG